MASFKQMQAAGVVKRADANQVELENIHEEPGFNLRVEGEDLDQSIRDLAGGLGTAEKNFDDEAEAAEGSAESTTGAANSYQDAAAKAADLEGNLRELIDTINEANGVGQDAVSSNAAYQSALAGIRGEVDSQRAAYEELNGTLDGFTLSLDEGTASGSEAASMLADVAGKAQAAALAQLALETNTIGSKAATDNYRTTLEAQRQAFIDSAVEAGYNADEVQKLADKVFALPSETELNFIADMGGAIRTIENFKLNYGVLRGSIVYRATQEGPAGDGSIGGYAEGGAITGPGTPTSDSVLIRASTGEHMLDARDVAAMGGQHAVYAFRESLHGGGGGGSTSIDNATITGTLEIGGDGLARIIDGRISTSSAAAARTDNAGRRVR